MKIDRSCATCESKNSGGICFDMHYGKPIISTTVDQPCWSIGLNYFNTILNALPEDMRMDYLHNPRRKMEIDDLINYLENQKMNLAPKSPCYSASYDQKLHTSLSPRT